MPPKLKFAEGERVLCFHGPLIYEAKCMKGQVKEKTPRYLIHYNGWNKNWDEWVPESRVLKFNEANLMRQKELKEQMYVIVNYFQACFNSFIVAVVVVVDIVFVTCGMAGARNPTCALLFSFDRVMVGFV